MNKGFQLFASRLDLALQNLLIKDASTAIDDCGWDATGVSSRYQPEIEGIIGLIYVLCSFGAHQPTPGMRTMNLSLLETLKTTQTSRVLPVTVLTLIYLFRRAELNGIVDQYRTAPDNSWKKRMHQCMVLLRTSFRFIGITNTLMFLWNGLYISVFNRICGYQLITAASAGRSTSGIAPSSLAAPRDPAYSNSLQFFKSRQIGWSTIVQLLGTTAYVFASSEAQGGSGSGSGSGSAVVGSAAGGGIGGGGGGVDWGIMNLWRQRWSRRCMRTLQRMTTGISSVAHRALQWRSVSETTEAAAADSNHVEGDDADRAGTGAGLGDITSSNTFLPTPVELVSTAVCVICSASPVEMPQRSACGHTYCYVCIFACRQQNIAWTASRTANSSSNVAVSTVAACLCPVCDALVAHSDDGLG